MGTVNSLPTVVYGCKTGTVTVIVTAELWVWGLHVVLQHWQLCGKKWDGLHVVLQHWQLCGKKWGGVGAKGVVKSGMICTSDRGWGGHSMLGIWKRKEIHTGCWWENL